jgi:DNA integrity scanning protein DisA with diadenylate cyclase activity
MVDWGDGTRTNSADLPVTYHYAAPGIYTITLTGEQSDGQSATKGITVDIRAELPGPPEPASSAPPPGDQTVFLIVIATAFVVAAAVAISQIFLSRRRDVSPSADIPEPIAEQEEIYYKAKQNGDMAAAAASARVCTRMFRSLAEESPGRRLVYLEMADAWEMKARNAERTGKPPQKIGSITENLPSPEDLQRICSGTDVTPEVALAVIRVAMEIAREGREGKAVGTSFVVGDTGAVLDNSRQFVLNPFHGYREDERQITDIGIRGNIKEFAQLDGAFVVSGPGVVEAAGRYITVDMSRVKIPGGLGSRHSSIAGITQATNSIGIVVSQSGGLISVFRKGKIVYTIGS